jgi:hypothetical protein
MELSQEQLDGLQTLLDQHKQSTSPVTSPVTVQPVQQSEFKINLGGNQYTARNQEELDRIIENYQYQSQQELENERLKFQSEAAARPAVQPQASAANGFDKEEYARLFMQDPIKANRYLVSKDNDQLAFYGQLMNEISALKQSAAASQFLLQNRDYEPTPGNFQALEKIVETYHLPWDINGMNAAYQLGLQTGSITRGETDGQSEAEPEAQFAPPRINSRRSTASQVDGSELLDQFENLTADKQREYLESLTKSR